MNPDVTTQGAAERVRQAAEEELARRAASQAAIADVERRRDEQEAAAARERDEKMAAFEGLKAAGFDAFGVANAAMNRLTAAKTSAQRYLSDHAAEHAHRRDVADEQLGRLLAGVPRQVEGQALAFGPRLGGPVTFRPTVNEALELAERALRAERVDEIAKVLRGIVDRGTYSPLTTPQYEAIRSEAGGIKRAIDAAHAEAQQATAKVGDALGRLRVGAEADAATPAAVVIDAEKRAQALLRDLHGVLFPQATSEQTTEKGNDDER